jgi:hypothetical protein
VSRSSSRDLLVCQASQTAVSIHAPREAKPRREVLEFDNSGEVCILRTCPIIRPIRTISLFKPHDLPREAFLISGHYSPLRLFGFGPRIGTAAFYPLFDIGNSEEQAPADPLRV